MKYIAVLLTVHNRKEKTLKCLSELFGQQLSKDFKLAVYLTNDGCTDGTPEAVKERFPDVVIVDGDGTLFWNRGMHRAWVEAANDRDYDFYLWLNDDTFIYPDCIQRLLENSKIHNDIGIVVGSTCAVGNKRKITYGGFGPKGLITDVSKPQPCNAINGNIVLISQAAYKVLGTNDPYFRHAAGDTDYGLRAKENGVPCFTGIGIFGECDLHEKPTVWMDPSQPFKKRWKNFMSPVGNNPFEFFYFKRKHFGIASACLTFISNWTHFFFPKLWKKSYKNYGR